MKYGDEVIRIGKDYCECKQNNIYTIYCYTLDEFYFVEIPGFYARDKFRKISDNIIELW